MPANADLAYTVIQAIATFEFPFVQDLNLWLKKKVYGETQHEENEIEHSPSIKYSEYITANPFRDRPILILLFCTFAMIFLTALILRYAISRSQMIQSLYIKVKTKVIWGVYIRFLLEYYLTMCIAITLKMYLLDFRNIISVFASVSTIIIFVTLLIIPIKLQRFLY